MTTLARVRTRSDGGRRLCLLAELPAEAPHEVQLLPRRPERLNADMECEEGHNPLLNRIEALIPAAPTRPSIDAVRRPTTERVWGTRTCLVRRVTRLVLALRLHKQWMLADAHRNPILRPVKL